MVQFVARVSSFNILTPLSYHVLFAKPLSCCLSSVSPGVVRLFLLLSKPAEDELTMRTGFM